MMKDKLDLKGTPCSEVVRNQIHAFAPESIFIHEKLLKRSICRTGLGLCTMKVFGKTWDVKDHVIRIFPNIFI